MPEPTLATTRRVETIYYLTELLGRRVMEAGKKLGRLDDLVISEGERVPVVTHLAVHRSFGRPSLLVPWEKVLGLDGGVIAVNLENLEKYEGVPPDDALLLKDHVLDKKVVDLEDREVEVVYDVKLVQRNDKLYVSEVDPSRYGLLRRVGLKGLANYIDNLARNIREKTISWAYIQPLPADVGSFKGNVKLNVAREKLEDLPPVDLADILEELEPGQRNVLFNTLKPEDASDALEEVDPNVQREIVSSLSEKKAAQLIDEMTPGQAADILAALPWSEQKDIFDHLDKEHARKIRLILEQQEAKVSMFLTRDIVRATPNETAGHVRAVFPRRAKGKNVVMYIYIVGSDGKLLGVVDIKELLKAPARARLRSFWVDNVVDLHPDQTLKEASALFARYAFRAVPVTDKKGVLVGAVTYRDVMNLPHRVMD